jgi:hypothetical protein
MRISLCFCHDKSSAFAHATLIFQESLYQFWTYAKHPKWHVISSESEVFVQNARKVECLTSFDMTLRKS